MLAAHGSLTIVANKFPAQLTPFVGRQDDIAAVGEVLAAARLVTLTGAGGIGKTRLALQAAAGLSDAFPDGLWWVGLASVSRGEQVLGALAQALGVREEEGAGLEPRSWPGSNNAGCWSCWTTPSTCCRTWRIW